MTKKQWILSKYKEGLTLEKLYSLYEEYTNTFNTTLSKKNFQRYIRKIINNTDTKNNVNNQSTKLKYQENVESGEANLSGIFSSKETSREKILKDVLKRYEIDTSVWEVTSFEIGEWDTSSKWRDQNLTWTRKQDNENNPQQIMEGHAIRKNEWVKTTNYRISVKFKRKKETFDKNKFIKELIEDVQKNYSVNIDKLNYIKIKNKENKNLFVPIMFDVHLGKLAWKDESGANYDVKLAQKNYNQALFSLLNEIKNIKIDEVLFITGQDFLNYDYSEPFPQTTAGTPQESDVRWQKMFRLGRQVLYSAIDTMYKNVAPIKILNIPGNHSYQSMWYLGEVLEAKYNNNKNVSVDNSAFPRKYHKYGLNLIGSCHGKDEKDVILHNLMTVDEPHLWAETKYRYFYLGHAHHEKELRSKTPKPIIQSEDYKGVIIEYMPSISNIDKYENHRGWIGSIRGAKALIHNYSYGRTHKIGFNL